MKLSLGLKFAGVVLLTVVTVGLVGFIAGRSILTQVVALADDRVVTDGLRAGQQALAELHRERQARVQPYLDICAKDPACQIPGVTVNVERLLTPVPADQPIPAWETESTYLAGTTAAPVRLTFAWTALKPRYAMISELIGTREHVTELLPGLTQSFLVVFAAALLGAGCLGLLVTFLLSRKVARRVRLLTEYTRQIAARQLVPAPASTHGGDELGLLADAMETMAKDLDEAQQRLLLAEKMHSWQAVARKVAHEIKNPLTPISLVAAELRRRAADATGELRATLEETSRILAEETESLGRMVREFTAFARLPEPDLRTGDVLEVVKDFVARNERDDGPRFVIDAPAAEAAFPAVIDRAMLAQVLHNLVNNARLAKAPARVTVAFALAKQGGRLHLDIADDAGGVPEALRVTLFDAYVSSRSTGDGEKGMGLGLAISRKIALDHGGSLELAATGPTGSRFRLTLPAATFGGSGDRQP